MTGGRGASRGLRESDLSGRSNMPKGIPGSGGVCTVDGCATGAIARGWCAKHYQRWRSHGDPVAGVALTFPENLLARMEPQPNGCIHYTGSLTLAGYGQVGKDGGNALAHRAAYEHFVGPIPEGMTLDHECHNLSGCTITDHTCPHRRCVNVEHLAPKSKGENTNASPNSWAAKTHCPQGHPYDEANTYVNPQGGRMCRACRAERSRRR